MCGSEKLTLIWVKKGKKYLKKINRAEMLVVFEGVANGFYDDNEVSLKLTGIIEQAEEIRLNKDVQESQDNPFIVYKINGAVNTLRIKRRHKIVWAILERFFT